MDPRCETVAQLSESDLQIRRTYPLILEGGRLDDP